MVRPSALWVWLYGTHVATITDAPGAGPGRIRWIWTEDATTRWGLRSRVVSHLLPIERPGRSPADVVARVFCQGLLPEGNARVHYAMAAGVQPDDVLGLLARYGRDTAGGLAFTSENERARNTSAYRVLSDDHVATRLAEVSASLGPVGLQSISLAGMVPKIGLVRTPDGHWAEPGEGAVSTWILKVAHDPGSVAADVVDTEKLCLHLAKDLGLTTIDAELVALGGIRAIAVSRYDRVLGPDGSLERLHQEDLAQAIGLNTTDPTRKFQRGAPMPSWRHAAEVLRHGNGRLAPLARLVCFSYLVGNTDHHAKNISFLRHRDNTVELAPAYDIAAHLHHPGDHLTALDVGGRRDFRKLSIDDVMTEIRSWDVPDVQAAAAVRNVTQGLHSALRSVDRSAYPGVTLAAWSILDQRVHKGLGQLAAAEEVRDE